MNLKKGEAVTVYIDARPYYVTEKQIDCMKVRMNSKEGICSFVPSNGNVYVYPSWKSSVADFRFVKDLFGSGYTLTIGNLGEIDTRDIKADELVRQGATLSTSGEYSSSSDFEGIF